MSIVASLIAATEATSRYDALGVAALAQMVWWVLPTESIRDALARWFR